MKVRTYLSHFPMAAALLFLAFLFGCNTRVNKDESKKDASHESVSVVANILIPDPVIQFLTDSTAQDLMSHKPPTVNDIRNVKAGYIPSGKDTTYLLCGEVFTKEGKDWVPFVTIKTSGYELYIGDNIYCQKAIFEKADDNRLTKEIKDKINN
jgi:hypothetical protein